MDRVRPELALYWGTMLVLALLPADSGATDRPVAERLLVNDSLVRSVLPEAPNSRLMRLEDLRDEWQRRDFLADRLSFVLEGDFDRDGRPEYVLAGRWDGGTPEAPAFVLILSPGPPQRMVKYFKRLPEPRVSLGIRQNCHKGFDAIELVFTPSSDYLWYLAWDGQGYRTLDTCDQ